MKRLSVLFSLLLTACLPMGTGSPVGCRPAPTAAESSDWERTLRMNTRSAYRDYLVKHPKSCYAPAAAERLRAAVRAAPVLVRPVPRRLAPPARRVRAY